VVVVVVVVCRAHRMLLIAFARLFASQQGTAWANTPLGMGFDNFRYASYIAL
jgi:hypothetical protein